MLQKLCKRFCYDAIIPDEFSVVSSDVQKASNISE
jgi:hypothetical protein